VKWRAGDYTAAGTRDDAATVASGDNMAPDRYRVVVRGALSDRFASAFGGMTLHVTGGLSTLEGEVRDQSELFGVLDRVRDLGLELVRVEPLTPAR
jgi:hypothetical protein